AGGGLGPAARVYATRPRRGSSCRRRRAGYAYRSGTATASAAHRPWRRPPSATAGGPDHTPAGAAGVARGPGAGPSGATAPSAVESPPPWTKPWRGPTRGRPAARWAAGGVAPATWPRRPALGRPPRPGPPTRGG